MDSANNRNLVVFLWGKNAQYTFLKALSETEIEISSIKKLTKPENKENITYVKNKNKLKLNIPLIRADINLKEDKIKLLITSHPTPKYKTYKKGFSKDAPNHFKACDEFLNEDVWKNFPENNQ